MPDFLVLLPKELGADHLFEAFKADHRVAAVAVTDFGSGFAGFAKITAETVDEAQEITLNICPIQNGPCLDGLMETVLDALSVHMPGSYNMFAFVELEGGRQQSYREHLAQARQGEGVRDARALLFGMRGIHAAIEVVGDDLTAVSRQLLALTEHPSVASVRSFVVGAENQRGFGGRTVGTE